MLLLIGPLGIYFSEILKNTKLPIDKNAYENIVSEMAAIFPGGMS